MGSGRLGGWAPCFWCGGCGGFLGVSPDPRGRETVAGACPAGAELGLGGPSYLDVL